ncbi:MAG: phosphatase PAP2 family protein [Burkholderiales bacterium]
MIRPIAVAVTDCGDLAVLLPMAAILALTLWRFESRAAAWAWTQALAVCLVATLVLKLGFLTCGRAWGVNIVSPSGHASMSTVVYGGFAVVMATRTARWRLLIIVAMALWISALAVSRTVLHFHSRMEVGIGLAVGLIALGVFVWKYRQLAHPKMNLPAIGMGAMCVLAVLYGTRLQAESFLYRFRLLSVCSGRT